MSDAAGQATDRLEPLRTTKLLLQLAALRDVLDEHDHLLGAGHASDVHPPPGDPAVLAEVPLLEPVAVDLVRQELRLQLAIDADVVGMRHLLPVHATELILVVADHALVRGVRLDHASIRVGHRRADGRRLEDRPEPQLALAQGNLGAQPVADVDGDPHHADDLAALVAVGHLADQVLDVLLDDWTAGLEHRAVGTLPPGGLNRLAQVGVGAAEDLLLRPGEMQRTGRVHEQVAAAPIFDEE